MTLNCAELGSASAFIKLGKLCQLHITKLSKIICAEQLASLNKSYFSPHSSFSESCICFLAGKNICKVKSSVFILFRAAAWCLLALHNSLSYQCAKGRSLLLPLLPPPSVNLLGHLFFHPILPIHLLVQLYVFMTLLKTFPNWSNTCYC